MISRSTPTAVCMITLTDVRNDLRIRKEAESLAATYDVHVLSVCENEPRRCFDYRGLHVVNVSLISRGLPKSPVFWIIKYVEFVLRATWSAHRTRARVYHGHEIAGAIPALFAARLRRAQFIYDAHELEADRAGLIQKTPWLHRLLLWSLRVVMRRADHVICASESRADIMLEEYGARERPTPILNVTPRAGLPDLSEPRASARAEASEGDEATKPRSHEGEMPAIDNRQSTIDNTAHRVCPVDLSDKRIVLYQGTLAPGRGLDRVVSALCHLDDDIVLMILGRGSTFDELIAQAERDGTRQRLIMVGQVPADGLVGYMKRAQVGLAIYLNTCRNNYHCAPNKVYEYASVGLPVVGPNFPDVEAVVSRYDIGRTFDPEDPTSIARAIRDVLDNPDRYAAMSHNAARLKEHVNWEGQGEKLRGIYEWLLTR